MRRSHFLVALLCAATVVLASANQTDTEARDAAPTTEQHESPKEVLHKAGTAIKTTSKKVYYGVKSGVHKLAHKLHHHKAAKHHHHASQSGESAGAKTGT